MIALRTRAPGKVNLCLYVGPVRGDGLHEVVSVVEPVSLADEVTLTAASGGEDEVACAGVDDTLATEALRRFRLATGWDRPAVRVEIDKRVPVAAGMGGGSSDAAAVLRLASRAAGEEGREEALAAIAPTIGADVPALLHGGPCLVTGAGEEVRPLGALPPHGVLVIPSGGRLSTATVYAEWDRQATAGEGPAQQLGAVLEGDRGAEALRRRGAELAEALAARTLPADLLVNDLEPAARALCPAIEPALEAAREAGADVATISGSGPTAVGLFLGENGPAAAARAGAALRDRFPGAAAVEPVGAEFAAVRS